MLTELNSNLDVYVSKSLSSATKSSAISSLQGLQLLVELTNVPNVRVQAIWIAVETARLVPFLPIFITISFFEVSFNCS